MGRGELEVLAVLVEVLEGDEAAGKCDCPCALDPQLELDQLALYPAGCADGGVIDREHYCEKCFLHLCALPIAYVAAPTGITHCSTRFVLCHTLPPLAAFMAASTSV